MKIIVLKFGGTSIGSIQRIKKVARIVKSYTKKYKVIILSSAMSGTTNKLIDMSKKIWGGEIPIIDTALLVDKNYLIVPDIEERTGKVGAIFFQLVPSL